VIHVDEPVVRKVGVEREAEQALFPVRCDRDLTERRWDELPLWIDEANPSGKLSPERTDCSCKSPVGGWLIEKFRVIVASLFASSLWL
jgi:hypothetical protein